MKTLGKNFIINASLEEAVNNSKVIIICVGTPGNADGSANLTYLLDAVKNVFETSKGEFQGYCYQIDSSPVNGYQKSKTLCRRVECTIQ